MKIELNEISVREICDGYKDDEEEGVFAFDGKLNVRPPYQREFVYDDKKRNAVIETVNKGFPLNVMYWAKNENGTFEIIDGQQRTLSLCQYVDGVFSLENQFFQNLTETAKKRISDYKLMIYVCDGNDEEKLEWFRTINIAGGKADRSGIAQRDLYGGVADGRKTPFQQNELRCLRFSKQIYERFAHSSGLFGNGVEMD